MKTKLITRFVLFSLLYLSGQCFAETPVQNVKDNAGPGQLATSQQKLQGPPKVIKIVTDFDGGWQEEYAKKEAKGHCVYAGNYLHFTITNPSAFLNLRPSDKAKVVLFINGIEMKGILSDWCSNLSRLQINSGQVTLMDTANIAVQLTRNDTTRAAWNYIYSQTANAVDNFVQLQVSIGWQNMAPLSATDDVEKITIIYYQNWFFWIWIGVYFAIVWGFLYIAIKTTALKDMTNIVTDPTVSGYDPHKKGVYSLSLTQLLFWTTLVIGAFIYCLVLTDMTSSLNSSVMLLIGISASTAGIAYVVDSNFSTNNPTAHKKQHEGFFKDILSDGTAYSVQRIQVFAWNFVLGIYFIFYTIANKTMPEFSTTLLFLAGISSASYLGAKTPENNNTKPPTASPGPNPCPNQNPSTNSNPNASPNPAV